MKIFITGIAGFLGSHLGDALITEGHEVYGNDILVCGDKNNWPGEFANVDCRNQNAMFKMFKHWKPDVVVHAAATAHEGLSSFSPSFITKNIYEASVATFSAAIAAGVKRIVYMSSMSRYGDNQLPFHESQNTNPVDPYAVSKVAAEDTLKILAKTHNVSYSILVPHNIIGTRQRYVDPFRNVASIMMNRCLMGLPPIVYGDGMQTRCFSPVTDCIPSVIKAVNGMADGEIVNIGPDSGMISILDLAGKIIALTGAEPVLNHMPDRPNEVKHAYCSSEKARKLLGYKENQSIDDCLKEMVDDIKEKGTKPFIYDFPIEIDRGCPETWLKRLM